MNGSAAISRAKVSADGQGVVSHAGVGMLREIADLTGLSSQVTAALADTYRGPWTHAPGDVFADLAAAVADGMDCVDGVGQLLGDREHVFGYVASTTTLWRLCDERIDAAHLSRIRAARAHARQQAWATLIGFTDHPDLARCEIETFRYRVLHVAARVTRGARQLRLRIDATWRWAQAIATAWTRIRTAFT